MVGTSKLPSIDRTVSLKSVSQFSRKLSALTDNLREQMLAPRPRKNPPIFTSTQVAEMCGIDRARLSYLATKEGSTLPPGELQGSGRSRQFTLAEARTWVQQVSGVARSPLLVGDSAQGKVLICSNFKGGSAKTTTTMCLAQGLTLLGRRVLVVDLDPQASLTELCGIYAEKDLSGEDTVLPLIEAQDESFMLTQVIQPTYWDGLDIIPAHPSLFSAEFELPTRVYNDPGFKFWTVLREGLAPLRTQYDYIILDTAPSLSYLTINGLMAADSMVMPLVPESLDFISSIAFWGLFSDLAEQFLRVEPEKAYDFVSILLSKVDAGQMSSAPIVRSWSKIAYGDWVSELEVPSSSVMSGGALQFATVFDVSKFEGGAKTLQRVRQPLEAYCKWVDDQYATKWGVE